MLNHSMLTGRDVRYFLRLSRVNPSVNTQFAIFVVVLKGQGVFTGGDGIEHTCGPNTLLIFNAGEQHAIRAVDELAFVGFLHGVPSA